VAVWNYRETDIYVPQIRKLGVPIFSFADSISSPAKLRALRRLIKDLKPEVVHSFSFYLNIAAHWTTRGTQAIALGSMRSSLYLDKRVNGWLLGNISARWPRTQIYNSSEAAKYRYCSRSLFLPKRVLVVQNGIDLRSFCALPLPTTRPVRILAIGSLISVKRWDRLLSVAAELSRRRLDFVVDIVGDGPLRTSLERAVKELEISDRVSFKGHVDDIPALLSQGTFLVHTSDAEGSPNAVMEAMACGRAVVATDVGDVASLVEDGTTGFVVKPGDHAMLLRRMVTLIIEHDLCKRMGETARAKAEREFGLDRLVSSTLVAYRAAGWKDVCSEETGWSRIAERMA
jgi:glycosyltransferase involved in cell wall biosynthesis